MTNLALFAALTVLAIMTGLYLYEGGRMLRRRLNRYLSERRAKPFELIVAEHGRLNDRLCRLRLARADGRRLPYAKPGQFITVILPSPNGQGQLRRRYSLAEHQHCFHTYELCIKREDDGRVSHLLYNSVKAGDSLRVLPPAGRFTLANHIRQTVVLIAGGIGITPLRAMLHARRDARPGCRTILFHAARRRSDLVYASEFEHLARSWTAFEYVPILSRPDRTWQGLQGRVTADLVVDRLNHKGESSAAFYICASGSMTDSLKHRLMEQGIGEQHIHYELFAISGTVEGPNATAATIHINGAPSIAFNGHKTFLNAFEAAQILLPAECRAGECGQCRFRVIRGDISWLIEPATGQPAGTALACCCRPAGDVTVELPRSAGKAAHCARPLRHGLRSDDVRGGGGR